MKNILIAIFSFFSASLFAQPGAVSVGGGSPPSVDAFIQSGNSFGTTAIVGTNDAENLQFKTNNTTRGTVLNTGEWGLGATPAAGIGLTVGSRLDVTGLTRLFGGGALDATGANQLTFSNTTAGQFAKLHTADDGDLDIYTQGTDPTLTVSSAGGLVFNENGVDYDFRAETDNVTNAFVVDAGTDKVQMNAGVNTGGWLDILNTTTVVPSSAYKVRLRSVTASAQASLPASPTDGDEYFIYFADDTFGNAFIFANGKQIVSGTSLVTTITVSSLYSSFNLVYDSTLGTAGAWVQK